MLNHGQMPFKTPGPDKEYLSPATKIDWSANFSSWSHIVHNETEGKSEKLVIKKL